MIKELYDRTFYKICTHDHSADIERYYVVVGNSEVDFLLFNLQLIRQCAFLNFILAYL